MAWKEIKNTIEAGGRIIAGSISDPAAIVAICELLENVEAGDLYVCITQKSDLVGKFNDWGKVKKFTGMVNLDEITLERVEEELKKTRIDLLSVLINTPGGEKWLQWQLDKAKSMVKK